jgi:hypothetical protein
MMSDREAPKPQRHCQQGFVPAEIYIRERGLCVNLADAFAWHAASESKRPARCIAEMVGAYLGPKERSNKLLNRMNLKRRQTMDAIPESKDTYIIEGI